mmetsp:Transcript_19539/g.61284  ORF Transcript_19539/g.61284 Transcript_19539/m.61284 type:complete len:286 (+) Transcript_19539:473-1330(+)
MVGTLLFSATKPFQHSPVEEGAWASASAPGSAAASGAMELRPQLRAPLLMRARVAQAVQTMRKTPERHVSQSPLPARRGLTVRAVMAMSLMRMFKAGPEVSLKGSPTVSATTHALPMACFLMPSFSQSFFALSQAPPALAMAMASTQPDTMEPASAPMRHLGPTMKPTMSGDRMAKSAGASISWMAARVAKATHRSLSGCTSSSGGMVSPLEARLMASISVMPRSFVTSRNCRRTSQMMAPAALPTESIVRPPKRKGSMPPRSTPARTTGSQTSKEPAGRPTCSL